MYHPPYDAPVRVIIGSDFALIRVKKSSLILWTLTRLTTHTGG